MQGLPGRAILYLSKRLVLEYISRGTIAPAGAIRRAFLFVFSPIPP